MLTFSYILLTFVKIFKLLLNFIMLNVCNGFYYKDFSMSLSERLIKPYTTAVFICLFAFLLVGCASAPQTLSDKTADEKAINDPLERVNRVTFAFNEILDTVLFTPLTKAYRFVVPNVARTGVHNVLDNLKSPVYLANELLQGNVKDAGVVIRRFATNTVLGVGGIVDVAAKQGVVYQPEDFGQTLASWGVGSGPYIVWPVFGPSSLRDSVGFVADMGMDPIYWYAMNGDHDALRYTRTGLTVLDAKDRTFDVFEDLRRNSGDLYTAVQSVYVQRRQALQSDSGIVKSALPTIE
jgi:phospholipid-binding lipoprotein MlaA